MFLLEDLLRSEKMAFAAGGDRLRFNPPIEAMGGRAFQGKPLFRPRGRNEDGLKGEKVRLSLLRPVVERGKPSCLKG